MHHQDEVGEGEGRPNVVQVPISVIVLDENDNAPTVVQPLQKVISVREKEPSGTVVAQIVATDPDLEENATIVYEFDKGI